MISPDSINKLKVLTIEDGLNLTDQELLEMATKLLNLVETVYKPIKKEWLEEVVSQKINHSSKV